MILFIDGSIFFNLQKKFPLIFTNTYGFIGHLLYRAIITSVQVTQGLVDIAVRTLLQRTGIPSANK